MYLQWGDAGLKCLFLVVVFIFCARGETWKKSGHIAIIQFTFNFGMYHSSLETIFMALAFNPSHFPRATPNLSARESCTGCEQRPTGDRECKTIHMWTVVSLNALGMAYLFGCIMDNDCILPTK